MSIGCETAAIDRWIEPATEPGYTCRKCGHEAEYHDEFGCGCPDDGLLSDSADGICPCEGFE